MTLGILVSTATCYGQLPPPPTISLKQAVLLSLHHNTSILSSLNNRKLQRYDLLTAQQYFKPQLTLTSTFNYTNSRGTDNSIQKYSNIGPRVNWTLPLGTVVQGSVGYNPTITTGSGAARNNSTSWSISIDQPLLKGFGTDINEIALKNAYDQQHIDDLNLQKTISTQILTVTKDYYGLAQAKQAYQIAQDSVKTAQLTVRNNLELYKMGRIARSDLNQSQQSVTTQQQSLQQSQQSLNTARSTLIKDMGIGNDQPFIIEPTVHITKFLPPLKQSIKQALNNNVDLKIALLTNTQQQRSLLKSKDDQRWGLNLHLEHTQTISSNHDLIDHTESSSLSNNSSASLTLNIPLNSVTIDQTRLKYLIDAQNQSMTLRTTRENLINTITTSWYNLKGQWQQLNAAKKNLTLAKESFKAAQAKQKFGMIDAFTLSQQQQTLIQAENALVTAQVNYLNQTYAFKQQLGSLFHEWNIHFKNANHSDLV